MRRRFDKTNLSIFALIVVFAVFALWTLLSLQARFERERADSIATIVRQFSPTVIGLPDDLENWHFRTLEEIDKALVRPNAYVRSIVVTKFLADRKEYCVLPFDHSLTHPNWQEKLARLERHSLQDREKGIEYGAIYFDFDNSRRNSVRGAIGALAVLTLMVLAFVGRRLWVQEVALTRTMVELEEKKRELVELERLSLAGKLSANIFHDVRKPMLNIRMDLEEVEAGKSDSPAARERMDDMRRQVELFFNILRDLNIERFIRGDQTGREFVNLNELLDRACALVRYERGSVEAVRDYAPSLPPLLAYPYRLIQVFSNIILNAYQAMAGKGQLRLTTRLEGAHMVVQIADSGPGISGEQIERIFEPFFTTRPEEGGSGLGLYISRGIVEDHGGSLTVSSQRGQGTTFEIRFPLPAQAPAKVE